MPDAPPPRRAAWLPWAIAGGVLLLLVLFLAAAIGIPLFLGARDRARAAVPLREPGAVGALPRVRDEYVQGKEREFIDNFRRGGYDNAVVATYSAERDGLLVLAVRTASRRARADFVPAARRDLEAQVPTQGPTVEFRRGELTLTCAPLRRPADATGWCAWSDDDTAGFTVGYGTIGAERLADLTTEAHTAILG